MQVEKIIRAKLAQNIKIIHIELENESYKHSVPPGSESHFKLLLVSDDFNGMTRVNRQKKIHFILEIELKSTVHAFSMRLLTSEEWKQVQIFSTPDCLGGDKKATKH